MYPTSLLAQHQLIQPKGGKGIIFHHSLEVVGVSRAKHTESYHRKRVVPGRTKHSFQLHGANPRCPKKNWDTRMASCPFHSTTVFLHDVENRGHIVDEDTEVGVDVAVSRGKCIHEEVEVQGQSCMKWLEK